MRINVGALAATVAATQRPRFLGRGVDPDHPQQAAQQPEQGSGRSNADPVKRRRAAEFSEAARRLEAHAMAKVEEQRESGRNKRGK